MTKKILITGALGQIGTELTVSMRKHYGADNVIASDIITEVPEGALKGGLYEVVDVVKPDQIASVVKKYNVNQIVHLAAILSAVGEAKPHLAWDVNMGGLFNVLEVARETKAAVFTPSSIAAFGPSTPPDNTPQDTLQRPTTMYGVTKVAGELLCDYYFLKYGVDTRGVRFPGLISYEALPGGGTTDYAVHIYYDALKHKRYTSYINKGTSMDMMYMPDALDAIMHLMEADPNKLIHRNAFNVTAMSFDPEVLAAEIKKHIPEFIIGYDVDPVRQRIADSWPNSLDDSAARMEWGWSPKYNLASMTTDMLAKLKIKLAL
ncbi:MAG: threonine dehydrogenase [Bacillota bacterium]|nr:MAG: threonine dehydrogenase [Bacillota bacterium]MBS3950422.1 L-threonine 3-dehydrogenase [Peptococcaceae bacterium]